MKRAIRFGAEILFPEEKRIERHRTINAARERLMELKGYFVSGMEGPMRYHERTECVVEDRTNGPGR